VAVFTLKESLCMPSRIQYLKTAFGLADGFVGLEIEISNNYKTFADSLTLQFSVVHVI
jgi:hypothetical protein